MASTEKIDAAAADWLARLDGSELPANLRAEFAAWCQANPRHYAAYLRLQHVWGRLDRLAMQPQPSLLDLQGSEPAFQCPERAIEVPPPEAPSGPVPRVLRLPAVLSRVAAAAVLLGLAVGVGLWLWPHSLDLSAPERRYATPVGGFERVTLADGSTLQLNTSSEVRVVLSKGRRDVTLIQGEATFEVAKDPLRPFVVTAGAAAVRAVGTNFDVRKISSGIEVMIIEGAVAVGPVSALTQPDTMPVVGAGQVVVTVSSWVQLKDIDTQEIARRLAWQRGMLGFDGQPLAEVAAEFNRYNERKLVIVSPSVGTLRIGGYFRATNLEAFVSVIEERFGISVTREPDQIILGGSAGPGRN